MITFFTAAWSAGFIDMKLERCRSSSSSSKSQTTMPFSWLLNSSWFIETS
ncbi:MAG: hypothetical protein ACLGHF_00810 [Alphaproteobacteria bacterium]